MSAKRKMSKEQLIIACILLLNVLGCATTATKEQDKAVSFKATRTTHVNLGGDDTLVFDTILEDTHDAYDSTTGVFKAPKSGHYLVTSTVLSQPGKYVPACVRKNGGLVMNFHTGESRKWNSGSLTLVEYMDAGDLLEIRTVVGQSGYVWGGMWTTFSAFRLSN